MSKYAVKILLFMFYMDVRIYISIKTIIYLQIWRLFRFFIHSKFKQYNKFTGAVYQISASAYDC